MPTAADPSILPVLVALVLLLASAAAFIFLRPRRTACPPSCRRCGYDVSQRPPDSTKCSECGADLAAPRSIVTTRRTRPLGVTLAAALLATISLLYFTNHALRFDWTGWYLNQLSDDRLAAHAEHDVGRGRFAARALDHWLARYRAGKLSAADRARLHEHLLKWQADTARPWDMQNGDVLLAAMNAGELSPAQSEQFVRNTYGVMTFGTRSSIRAGDPVPLTYAPSAPSRGGNSSRIRATIWAFASFVGPPEIPENRKGRAGTWLGHPTTTLITPKAAGTPDLAPGRRTLHVLFACELTNGPTGRETAISPIVRWRKTIDVDVRPAGSPIGELAPAPELADAVARSIELGVYRWPDNRLFARVALKPAHADRAFEVYVEHAGKRHLVARRYAAAGQASSYHNSVDYVPIPDSPDLKSLKLIAVGSPEPLADSPDQRYYWPGTIVFPHVPLEPQSKSFTGVVPPREYEIQP